MPHDSRPVPLPPTGRRHFLALASGCLACSAAGAVRVLAAPPGGVDVGTLADHPADTISEKFVAYDFFVIRHDGRLFACTATCPHKGNALLLDAATPGRIVCSGHDSVFSSAGLPQRGPARRPLVRYGIALDSAGRVRVDRTREFPRPQWADPASFVPLTAG
jgi:nitrite reductase/ring-hydroxylating ferredoxin subunit